MTVQLYNPAAPAVAETQASRRTLNALAGKTIGFIDNSKPNFNYLVDDLADALTGKYGVARVVKRRKRSASQGAPEAVLNELVESCDAIITGSGD